MNINYIPGNNSLTQNQSRNPLHYSMLSWTNSIGSCTLLWKKIKNSSFLWVTVMPGFFFYVFAAFNPDLRYHLSKSFLSWHMIQCKEACERLVFESIKSSNQLYIRGGGLKKKNFFLNQIYFEIGMFIYIVSSRVYNCAYLWNAPLVKIYVSGLVHFPRFVCLFSVNALILRCTVAEVFDVILHSLSVC